MANVTHSTRTDPNLHEPKGVANAAAGRIAQADGAGAAVWTRPIDLIAGLNDTSGTSYEVTGLSAYRELIISVENMTNTSLEYFLLQLYSTSGAAWRTSGYLNSLIGDALDYDNNDIDAEGLVFGRARTNGVSHQHSVLRISNFNDASIKTSHYASGAATRTNYVNSATVPTDEKPHVYTGMYNTAEAHEGIRFRVKGANNFTSLYTTIWGIKG